MKQIFRPVFICVILLALIFGAAGTTPARAVAATPGASLSPADWAQIKALLPPTQQGYLKASNADGGDLFGFSVAVSGDTAVVGAYQEDSSASGGENDNSAFTSGAVYVFTRSGTTWSQQAYLKASNAEGGDAFGFSVAVSGDTLAVGAYREDSSANGGESDNSAADSGAVYVFTRSGTVWSQQAYLKASNAEAGDYFGWGLAISGDTLAVGAYAEDSSAGGGESDNSAVNAGATYVFTRTGTVWSQQAYLKASNAEGDDLFGYALSIVADTLVVGAVGEDSSTAGVQGDNSAGSAGAVYIFTRSGTAWSQQAYLKASNAGAGDYFGTGVSLSGDTLVVGAPTEDSSAGGGENDNSVVDAGAVYVFTGSGSSWSQQAYLKASNAETTDHFGISVGLDGDTMVVGANFEDSSVSAGIADNSAVDAGAVYVFTRSATIWSEQASLKASNADAGDNFGIAVAISGDTMMVGSYGEDSSASGGQADNSAGNAGAAYVFAAADSIAPAAPVVSAPANGSSTIDNTPTVSGTAEAGSTVTVYLDGSSAGTTSANVSGNWSWTVVTPLSDGPHTVKATATDAASNISPDSGTNTFTVSANADLIYNQSYLIKYDTWIGATSASSYSGGYRHATSGNFTFRAPSAFTTVTWLTYRGPDQGKAQVLVDGVLKTTVDLYSATIKWQSPVVISGLSNAKHVIVIKATNTKNAASSNRWVAVDGFRVGATTYDDDRIDIDNLTSYGSWLNTRSTSARFRGYGVSTFKNATASFTYIGASFDWVTARGPAYGTAAVYVDGVLKKTVDLYSANQQWQYHVIITGIPSGTHTVVVKVLGTKNASSTGVGVVSDGFVIQ